MIHGGANLCRGGFHGQDFRNFCADGAVGGFSLHCIGTDYGQEPHSGETDVQRSILQPSSPTGCSESRVHSNPKPARSTVCFLDYRKGSQLSDRQGGVAHHEQVKEAAPGWDSHSRRSLICAQPLCLGELERNTTRSTRLCQIGPPCCKERSERAPTNGCASLSTGREIPSPLHDVISHTSNNQRCGEIHYSEIRYGFPACPSGTIVFEGREIQSLRAGQRTSAI